MIETVGLVLGIADPIINRAQTLFEQIESYKSFPKNLETAKSELKVFSDDTEYIKSSLKDWNKPIDEGVQKYLNNKSASLQLTVKALDEAVQKLDAIVFKPGASSSAPQKRRIMSTLFQVKKVASHIDEVVEISKAAREECQHIITQLNIILNIPQQAVNFHSSSGFKPSFLLPELPNGAVLDFDTSPDDGRQISLEASVKQRVLKLSQDREDFVAAVTGVSGMGGIGKTIAMIGLGTEKEIQACFTDGVYFIRLGQNATDRTVINQLSEIVQLTFDHTEARRIQASNDADEAVAKVSNLFRGKKALFLCDDLWASDALPYSYVHVLKRLLRHSEQFGSCMLFTTREFRIAKSVTPNPIAFLPRESSGPQAIGILLIRANNVQMPVHTTELRYEDHKGELDALLEKCDGVPLTLAVAGSGLASIRERKASWGATIADYTNHISNTSVLFQDLVPDYPRNLEQIIRASLSMISDFSSDPDEQLSAYDFFLRLCIFEKQALISERTLRKLWGELCDDSVRILRSKLVNLGLFSTEGTDENVIVKAHDHIIEFTDFEAGRLGVGDGIFVQFLNAYIPPVKGTVSNEELKEMMTSSTPFQVPEDRSDISYLLKASDFMSRISENTRAWWDLPVIEDNIFVLNNLIRLLCGGGMLYEAVCVMANANWTLLRLQSAGIVSLLEDFSRTTNNIDVCLLKDGHEIHSSVQVVGDAVNDMSHVVIKNMSSFPSEVIARLEYFLDGKGIVANFIRTALEKRKGTIVRPMQQMWKRPRGPKWFQINIEVENLTVMAICSASMVAYGFSENILLEVDIRARKLIRKVELPGEGIAMSSNRKLLVLKNNFNRAGSSSSIILWDVDQRNKVWGRSCSKSEYACEVSNDCRTIALKDYYSKSDIQVLDGVSGKIRFTIPTYNRFAHPFSVSGDGNFVISSSPMELKLWDGNTGKIIWSQRSQNEPWDINAVYVNRDGSLLASVNQWEVVTVWARRNEQDISSFEVSYKIKLPEPFDRFSNLESPSIVSEDDVCQCSDELYFGEDSFKTESERIPSDNARHEDPTYFSDASDGISSGMAHIVHIEPQYLVSFLDRPHTTATSLVTLNDSTYFYSSEDGSIMTFSKEKYLLTVSINRSTDRDEIDITNPVESGIARGSDPFITHDGHELIYVDCRIYSLPSNLDDLTLKLARVCLQSGRTTDTFDLTRHFNSEMVSNNIFLPAPGNISALLRVMGTSAHTLHFSTPRPGLFNLYLISTVNMGNMITRIYL